MWLKHGLQKISITVKSCVLSHFFPSKILSKVGYVLYIETKFYPIFSERVSGYRRSMTAVMACYASCMSEDKTLFVRNMFI